MAAPTITCDRHGAQDLALACIHACRAIDSGENVGFFWSTDTDGPRPDAWCSDCEGWLRANPAAMAKDSMAVADFQFLCAVCWDDAKRVLYDQYQQSVE